MLEPEGFKPIPDCTKGDFYYSTLIHEIVHGTGNEKCLNLMKSKKFGDQEYTSEELVAELGATFLCAELKSNLVEKADHASYIESWLKVLKETQKYNFIVPNEASKTLGCLQSPQIGKILNPYKALE